MKAIISVLGAHGGDEVERILENKISDVKNAGFAFWMTRSVAIKPELLSPSGEVDCFFIAASGATMNRPFGNARPAVTSEVAAEFSTDRKSWTNVPSCFRVTGKLSDGFGRAMVIRDLERWKGRNER